MQIISRSRSALVVFLVLVLAAAIPAQTRMFTVRGDSAGDNMGISAAGAGDLNNDGFDDFIAGSPYDYTHGSVHVYSGFDAGVLAVFYGTGATPGLADNFGYSVDGAGDVNNDGVPDFVIGAPQYSFTPPIGSGYVKVISGSNGAPLHTFTGAAPGDFFGFTVSGAGDVNNDGYADVIVGANTYTTVYSGLTGGQLFSVSFGGSCVSGAGDTNGDGYDDVIIGSEGVGEARLYRGPTGTSYLALFATAPFDGFGMAVSGAGDVNGDGNADVIVGASEQFITSAPGYARVHSGLNGTLLQTFIGDSVSDRFGWSVSGAGDVSGDGLADVIVGAPYDDNFGSASGSARAFSVLSGAILFTVDGDSANDFFGWWVSDAGKINGDLRGDVIVGAFGDAVPGLFAGSAQVFSGAPLPVGAATVVGTGCGGVAPPPTLTTAAYPMLGHPFVLLVSNATPGATGYLFAAAGTAVSQPLGGGCTAFLDLSTFATWVNVPIATNALGSWAINIPLSPSHVFAGLTVTAQAALFPTAGPLGVDLTNGLQLTLGY